MRLWHVDLISVLPRLQLLRQWQDCCCIAENIANKGTPDNMLVNKMLEYRPSEFLAYTTKVKLEMKNRGYKVSQGAWDNFMGNMDKGHKYFKQWHETTIFDDWMDKRYLTQCYYNLQEQYDCGGITSEEWNKIVIEYDILTMRRTER